MTDYTEEEIELFRQQLRHGNELAREAIKRRGGVKLHPRIAAMRAHENNDVAPNLQ